MKTDFLPFLSAALEGMPKEISSLSRSTVYNLFSELDEEGSTPPEDFLGELLGSGSYKEAYQVGDICVKFSRDDNVLDAEMATYETSAEYGIQYIFCPTTAIQLPTAPMIPMYEIDEEEVFPGDARYDAELYTGFGHCFDAPLAGYVILQPIVEMRTGLTCPNSPISCDENPLILEDGGALSVNEYLIIDAPLEWRQSIIEHYGDLAYRDICWGLKRLGIIDLHQGNVGWLNDRPVIIDWMSYS